jgi:ribosomal protein L13E
MLKVDKDVAISDVVPVRKAKKKTAKWSVLDKMDVGDSFVVGSKREAALARAYAHRHGMKVNIRRVDIRKHRVWKAQ